MTFLYLFSTQRMFIQDLVHNHLNKFVALAVSTNAHEGKRNSGKWLVQHYDIVITSSI